MGNSKGSQIHFAKNISGSSKDCKIQSLLCDKASGNSKGSKIHCAKNFSGSSKDCKIQPLLCDKASGNSKGSKIHCAKNFSARFSLYCATKFLGTAKVARFTVPKKILGAAKIARFSLYCATKLLATAKVARFTVPKIFLGAAKIARLLGSRALLDRRASVRSDKNKYYTHQVSYTNCTSKRTCGI